MKITKLELQSPTETTILPASLRQQTLLFFMRAANCPICIQHVRQLEKMLPELAAKRTDVIVVAPEGIAEAKKLVSRYGLHMPVLAGNGLAHSLAGFDTKLFGTVQQSGTIIVDASGNILYSKISTIPLESFSHKEIRAFLGQKPTR